MLTATAIEHFGSQALLARALGIKQPSIAEWGAKVPWRRQLQIELHTNGALKHDPADLPADLREYLHPPARPKRKVAA